MIHAKGPRRPVTTANEDSHAVLTSKYTVAWSMAKKVRIVGWIALNGRLCLRRGKPWFGPTREYQQDIRAAEEQISLVGG